MTDFRKMTLSDIPSGLTLCRHAGWNQLASDWEIFLTESPEGCLVATENNEVIGTVTTIRYEDRFAWIGMVLVHPLHRKKGLGTALLQRALDILEYVPCVKLDATPAGREVYLRLGFVDEYPLKRLVCATFPVLPTSHVHPVGTDDFSRILETDRYVFGASRANLLKKLFHQYPLFVFAHQGGRGYCFGRKGKLFNYVGPIVAGNIEEAKLLLSAVGARMKDLPVAIDVTMHDQEWMRWLHSIGFEEQRPFTRMFRGTNDHPGEWMRQWSILGPEFG